MNETDFQSLYEQYVDAKNDLVLQKQCIETLHGIIYSYPMRRHKADPDTASDFYLYVYDKIDTMFKEYSPARKVSFLAFVSVKLRFFYLRFHSIKSETKQTKTSWNDAIEASVSDERAIESEKRESHWAFMKTKIHAAMVKLDFEQEVSVRLHFGFVLKLSQLRELALRHKGYYAFKLYRSYMKNTANKIEKERKQKEVLLKKIIKVSHQEQLEDNQIFLEKKETYLQEFFSLRAAVTLKEISDLMKLSITNTHRKLKEGIESLKKFLVFEVKEFRSLIKEGIHE